MMKSSCPLLVVLLLLVERQSVSALCSLDKSTTAHCSDLEDARYIDTYELHALRAPTASEQLVPGNFKNLTSLRHLDLSGGKIRRINAGSFSKLGFLQTLNLADNHISHLEVGAFDGLKQVHSLLLGNNEIKQLPLALMSLKELRMLDLSGNPLNCNCASMKLRDALLARGVKISKKTMCSEPVSAKHASILKPDTKTTCSFEKQDKEMQADQPAENESSGELEEEDTREVTESEEEEEKGTPAPTVPEEEAASSGDAKTSEAAEEEKTTEESAADSTEAPPVPEPKNDITEEEASVSKESSTEAGQSRKPEPEDEDETSNEADDNEDVVVPDVVSSSTTEESAETGPEKTDEVIVSSDDSEEGSGDSDDEGSGADLGSGMIASMPHIDFNETTAANDSTTTEAASWWGFGDIISNLNPFGGYDSTEEPSATEKSTEDNLKEEQFIEVTQKPLLKEAEPVNGESSNNSPSASEDQDFAVVQHADSAFSQEARKGMGSYIVLAILLAILASLIIVAAYKGDFCRRKPKRRDVERGTELRDMQKSLLEQSAAQPKVQVANGNTLENVPLMYSSAPPEEPKDNQKSYDIGPVGNGSSKPNGQAVTEDPVKPPRKPASGEIEAPLNGLNPPMDDIDAPSRTSLYGDANDAEDYAEKPPLSPGAQRVKITLQDIPESVPKTPILITRLKGGENLVKTP